MTESPSVTVWLDPVCPYSWNTARWLSSAADTLGFDVDWRLANLAILNEGRELPPAQRARMADSRRIGRLMAAIQRDMGAAGLATAYFTFGQRYFDESPGVIDADLIQAVLDSTHATVDTSIDDTSLDALVRDSHAAGQAALGETGGSPIVSIDGHAFFGPVLTSVPTQDQTASLFKAVAALAETAQFSQLQRPRPAHV